ncbi:MAG: hypothetical protein REJ24_14750 [Rhodocyclaceae bacterium]|nr:hypothetical protein [Pseudomonadota bacterium]MDQ7973825.1 hypothetical protein [Rhodocyclaceae bacterium]MDQ8001258.1 hypothetical protein [Pseudomonadota bacterium]MDQ8019234.1 hypothetical protein [Pseudomonadota bacterium]
MSLDYLARIEKARFPLVVRHSHEVDSVRLLKAAELITASVPRGTLNLAFSTEGEAVVFGLTELGERVLRQSRLPPEAPLRRGRAPLDDD